MLLIYIGTNTDFVLCLKTKNNIGFENHDGINLKMEKTLNTLRLIGSAGRIRQELNKASDLIDAEN